MKKSVVSALAVAALAGAAFGQAGNNVRLDVRIVPQNGLPSGIVAPFGTVTDQTDTVHDQITAAGDIRRFEVQFRIIVPAGGTGFAPAGLTAGSLRIVASGATGNGTLERALISRFESTQAGSTAPGTSDSSGVATNAFATARGLHRPYRGGIGPPAPNNDNPANGTFSANSLTISGITPLSLSQSDQNAAGGPDGLGAYYGLFSFNFVAGSTLGSGNITFTASFDADASPPNNKFGFFDDGNPVPITSPNATGGTATAPVIPAPGAFALIGLGGLVAARRRRA